MWKFIFKGVIRDRSRSFFPIMVSALGVAVVITGHSMITGINLNLINTNAYFDTGHVKVVSKAYADEIKTRPIELSLADGPETLKKVQAYAPQFDWSKRARFGGILDIPNEQGETRSQSPVIGMAVDLLGPGSQQAVLMKLPKSLKSGRLPQKPGEMVVSHKLAEKLAVKVGDPATLMGATVDSANTSANFIIVGTLNFGIAELDRQSVVIDIGDAESLLAMENYLAELLGFAKGGYQKGEIREFADQFNREFKSADPYSPVALPLEDQNNLKPFLELQERVSGVILFIFFFLITLVLWNAGLVNGLRRYSEIGMRLAIGERRSHILNSLLMESLFTGILGTLFGMVMGFSYAYYLQEVGIDYSKELEEVGIMLNSAIRAKITYRALLFAALPGIFSGFLGMLVANLGVYQRETSQLFKELET